MVVMEVEKVWLGVKVGVKWCLWMQGTNNHIEKMFGQKKVEYGCSWGHRLNGNEVHLRQ